MITEREKVLLAKKGISEDKLNTQLACFAKGFPYLRLAAAASTEKGILAPSHEEVDKYLEAWEAYTNNTAHRIVKFVPASGAASRMFKNMFAFVDADYTTPTTDFENLSSIIYTRPHSMGIWTVLASVFMAKILTNCYQPTSIKR